MGAHCCFALKVTHWWHLSMCSFAWVAIQGQKKWLSIRLSMHSRPRWLASSWHPFNMVSQCVAGKTNWNWASWESLCKSFLYKMPHLSFRLLCSQRNMQTLVGQLVYTGSSPGSHPASSQSWGSGQGLPFGPDANHQQSWSWPAGHFLLGPGHVGCSYMPQWGWWGLWVWLSVGLIWPLQWLGGVFPKLWAHSWAKIPLTRHPHQC